MIIQGIIDVVTAALGVFVSLFPKADPDTIAVVSGGVSTFRDAMEAINWFFPADSALTFLALIFAIEFSVQTFRLVRWIVGIISLGFIK